MGLTDYVSKGTHHICIAERIVLKTETRINSVIFLSNNKNNDNFIEYFLIDKLWSSLLLDFISYFITFYLPWLPGTVLGTSLNPVLDADSNLFGEKKMKQHYGII